MNEHDARGRIENGGPKYFSWMNLRHIEQTDSDLVAPNYAMVSIERENVNLFLQTAMNEFAEVPFTKPDDVVRVRNVRRRRLIVGRISFRQVACLVLGITGWLLAK